MEITDLEFGTHGFLMNHVFLPTEQAETNICWIIYQDTNFKICLSLFSWKENILPKLHIVQWLYLLLQDLPEPSSHPACRKNGFGSFLPLEKATFLANFISFSQAMIAMSKSCTTTASSRSSLSMRILAAFSIACVPTLLFLRPFTKLYVTIHLVILTASFAASNMNSPALLGSVVEVESVLSLILVSVLANG